MKPVAGGKVQCAGFSGTHYKQVHTSDKGTLELAFNIILTRKHQDKRQGNMFDLQEDRETGETHFDHETGEELNCFLLPSPQRQVLDAETGEPEIEQANGKKRSFHIPKTALLPKTRKPGLMLPAVFSNKLYSANCLERKVECVSRNMSPIAFLLPTLFLFPGWATVLLIVLELMCHTWAHKKNKLCKDSNIIYRSPLNMITSEFCAYCRSHKAMLKIGKLQDERLLQVHNRKHPYCTYVEKMSVIT